jgi:hypothetical protein
MGRRLSIVGIFATLLVAAAGTRVILGQSPSPAALPSASSQPYPSPAPTPSWTPAPPVASREIIRDPFDTPGSWWTGSDEIGTSRLAVGGMRWRIAQDRRSIWDLMDLPGPLDRVRVEAAVLIEQGTGGGGPICAGDDPGARSLWAMVNGDGEWLVGRIVDGHVQVVDRGDLPIVRRHDVPVGAPYPLLVTLECAVDPSLEGDRATVWIDGAQVADVVDQAVGPYVSVGLTATADQKGLAILFDDFAAYDAPPAADESPSPGPSGGDESGAAGSLLPGVTPSPGG